MANTYKVMIGMDIKEYPEGITFKEISKEYQKNYENDIVLVRQDDKLQELHKKLTKNCRLSFITTADKAGNLSYKRSATHLMLKAIYDVLGSDNIEKVSILFSMSKGYFCRIKALMDSMPDFLAAVDARMKELVELDLPITKSSLNTDDAVSLFRVRKMYDKERLFKYRRVSKVNVYGIDGFEDYYYGYMLPSTGYIKYYELIPYEDGFVIQLPLPEAPKEVPPFVPQKKLFDVLSEAKELGERLNLETVADLNDTIVSGKISDMILVQEALQEKKIGEIAQQIAENPDKKIVMIAGPSSSGKTSFSHRLSIQLRTMGKVPHPIALDDYFVDRELTPLDENGNYNFECLGAIDVELFNQDMCKLLAGERVELPTFNFKIGKREYHGNYKQLGPEDILVIEGIHGLNEKMSYSLPNESKYKVYISALTSMNVDGHNRIPTTDGRLLRRMVRDARTRGADAKRTIGMWPSVRRGEEENIFPFQEEADAMFNSALIYELAALKPFAEPLLFSITKDQPEYYEAKRLLKFLDYFLSISSESLPNNSICREFVGGSCFKV